MKQKRFLYVVMLTVMTVLCLTVAACGVKKPNESSDDPTKPVIGPEVGQYYCYVEDGTYNVTLSANNNFTAVIDGENMSGTYELADGNLTLKFGSGTAGKCFGKVAETYLVINYGGSELKFYKNIAYTVRFDTNGGSSIADAKVANGDKASKPAENPTKTGHVFLGWYADAGYTKSFAFESQIITENTTVYARWAEVSEGQLEYTVAYDYGKPGMANPAEQETIGGKLYNLPECTEAGFLGWWVSMVGDGEQLAYEYKENEIKENTTLYALWAEPAEAGKLEAPVVNVSASKIEWNRISNTNGYEVTIEGPDGFKINTKTSTADYAIDFAAQAAGNYTIKVKALSNTASVADSAETVRVYRNKALAKVSKFSVTGTTLAYNAVENATNYILTINCGNENHNHSALDNGSNNTYNFENCSMREGGITFVVRAEAEGYAPSVSETYVYSKDLGKVNGLAINDEKITWNAVNGAAGYMLTITCGNHEHAPEYVAGTSYGIKNCSGEISVSVQAMAFGANAGEAAEASYTKNALATPANVVLNGNTLSWDKVEGATSYKVTVNGAEYEVTGNSYSLANAGIAVGQKASVSVVAVGAANSVASDAVEVYNRAMGEISYKNGVVTWPYVMGADSYSVTVNGENAKTVVGANSVAVELTRSGANEISVCYYSDGEASNAAKITVNAKSVTLNGNAGMAVGTKIKYYVNGDKVELPEAVRTGYTFGGWYNNVGGATANGAEYSDVYFNELSDIVLYAYWIPNEYKVTLNPENGGEASEATVVFGSNDYQLPVPESADETLGFVGWYIGKDGSGINVSDAYGYAPIMGTERVAWSIDRDIALYACWKPIFKFHLEADDTYSVKKDTGITTLKKITVPAEYNGKPISIIDGYAFQSCSVLEEINIPNTVRLVYVNTAFSGCASLKAVNVYEVEGIKEALYASDGGVLYSIDTSVENTPWTLAFFPIGKGGAYTINRKATSLGNKAIANNDVLTELTIPNTVVSLEAQAIYCCDALTKITFEEDEEGFTNTLTIAPKAFQTLASLVEVNMPARLVDFDPAVFAICKAMQRINVQEGGLYKSLEGMLVDSTGQTIYYCPVGREGELVIPESVSVIGDSAFSGCAALTKVVIHGAVTNIGASAFTGCSALEEVVFKGSDFATGTVIGEKAFYNLSDSLLRVTYENGAKITEIGSAAFKNCSLLEEIYLPASLTLVKANAFEGCTGASAVTFAENGEDITFEEEVFKNCTGLTYIFLPSTVTEIELSAFEGCTNISNIEVDENNPILCDIDGILFSKDQTTLYFFPAGRTDEYVVPSTVTTIAANAFAYRNLTSVVIPKSVTSIGEGAFYEATKLEKVIFKEGGAEELVLGRIRTEEDGTLDFIGVFEKCSALTEINLPTTVTVITERTFYSTKALKKLEIPAGVTEICDDAFWSSGISELKLPEGLKSIGNMAFYNCDGLVELNIPNSVNFIDYYAFGGCNGLTTVNFMEGDNTEELVLGTLSATTTNVNTFYYSSNISKINIPSRLKKIGGHFLAENKALESLFIPNTVEYISNSAFYASATTKSALRKAEFEDGDTPLVLQEGVHEYNPYSGEPGKYYGLFAYQIGLKEIIFGNRITKFPAYMLYHCEALESLTIPNGITQIGDHAIYYCDSLTEVTIPNTVKNGEFVEGEAQVPALDTHAIAYCDALETINFEAGNENDVSLAKNALIGNIALKSVNLPKNFTDLLNKNGEPASKFEGTQGIVYLCTVLESINIEEGGKYYASKDGIIYTVGMKELVYCPVMKAGELVIPNTVTLVRSGSFADNKLITAISFEEGGEEPLIMGNDGTTTSCMIFKDNSGASGTNNPKKITFPKRLAKINTYALYNICAEEVVFAADCDLTEICDNAFYSADQLVNINLEVCTKLETIGEEAFAFSGIENLVFPASLKNVGEEAFKSCKNLAAVTLSDYIEELGTMFTNCTNIQSINVPETNTFMKTVDGVIFDSEMKLLQYYPVGKTDAEYAIPKGVEEIGLYAFNANGYITKVTIPATVKLVGEDAFYKCEALAEIVFEEADVANGEVEAELTFGPYSLAYTALTEFKIPARATALGSQMFFNCGKLKKIEFAEDNKITVIPTQLFSGAGVSTITIPANVTEFANNAFNQCFALTEILFAENSSLTTIGQYAFSKTTRLKNVQLPESVTKVGTYMFEKSGIEEITLPGSINQLPNYTFKECSDLHTVILDDGFTSIANASSATSSPFYKCTALTTVSLPDTLKTVGNSVFRGLSFESVVLKAGVTYGNYVYADNTALKEVIIPAGVAGIGTYAFNKCTSLEKISIGEGITSMGNSMFEGCTALKSAEIPASVTTMGNKIFKDCEALETVTFAANSALKTVGGTTASTAGNVFQNCVSLKRVEFPSGVTIIANAAFTGCTSLEEVVLPDGVVELGSSFFEDCKALTKVVMPAKVVKLGTECFRNCESLQDINVSQFTSLGTYCFQNSAIKEATINSAVKKIPNYLFAGCTQLEKVVLHDLITEFGYCAFANCSSLTALNLPAKLSKINSSTSYPSLEGCTALKTLTVSEGNITYVAENNAVYSKDMTKLFVLAGGVTGEFVIPDTVTTIEAGAFAGGSIESVVFGANVDTVGNYLFRNAVNLKSVKFNEALTKLGSNTFEGVMSIESLEQIDFANITALGNYAFKNSGIKTAYIDEAMMARLGNYTFQECQFLESVEFAEGITETKTYTFNKATALKSVKLPSTLTTINNYAFQETAIEAITIPASVTLIDSTAFKGCANLSSVIFEEGSQLSEIDTYAFQNTTALESIQLPDSLLKLGNYAFRGSGIKSLEIPDSVTTLGTYLVAESAVSTVKFPAGIATIPNYAFYGCLNLKSFEIPESVTKLGSYTFAKSGIESITIPEGMNMGVSNIFMDCVNLKEVNLPENVLDGKLNSRTFEGCISLEKVNIPKNVTTLPGDFFLGCAGLKEFVIPEYITTLNYSVFEGCTGIKEIFIPLTVTSVGNYVFEGWTADQTIIIECYEEGVTPNDWYSSWNYNCEAKIVWKVVEAE